ncbi:MAG: cytochrome c3 family protein [Pyrinomonadaceae bacterium]
MKHKTIQITAFFFLMAFCLAVWIAGAAFKQNVQARNSSVVLDSKELPTKTTLNKDSTSEYGEVAFNHDSHSFKKYSPDGKTDISCAECHHTDQPKEALKAPLVTSERKDLLTVEVLKKADAAPVKSCRTCHFQEGNVPDDKSQAIAVYKKADGKDDSKEINNEVAFHTNCNVCHDAAAKLRPELKKKAGFATTNDCLICHQKS